MGSKHKKTTQNVTFKKARKKFFKPTYEIYSEVKWKKSKVKKAIRKKKLAPIFSPNDDQDKFSIVECPICSYFFPIANMTTCCKKPICTECYLQICPKLKSDSSDRCPWCRSSFFSVCYQEEYRKNFLKEQKNECDEQLLELEKQAQKNEKEEFDREREKALKLLLEIKDQEEKEGKYDEYKEDERKKQQQREMVKLMFEQQKRNQENTNDQNNDENNFHLNFNNNNQIIQPIEELEEPENQEEINLNNLYDYIRNPRRLNQLQANQLNNLMVEEAIRLSTQQN
ncbi:protein sip5 [Anaeramoeba flamelloides]|uniref:Protein sip5 n=1 Tax=Anaeramoeba flamelloides TaxID=1746091 RepID=A0ABQ8XB60_9EUKA|nr:protein sip5 [Anaeramoeba flamelloides]